MTVAKLRALVRRSPVLWPLMRAARVTAAHFAFRGEFERFRRLSALLPAPLRLEWRERQAELGDNTRLTRFDRHYVFHTAWAARIIAAQRPNVHVDISSSLYFVGIASAFVPIFFFDYRPARLGLSNLVSGQASLLALPFRAGSLGSISCLHVVEHIGLGRYGDALDPAGDVKAIAELKRVLAPGGNLLFVTPVGAPKVRFNAHRIYAFQQIVEAFAGLSLKQFALVPDDPRQDLLLDASPALANQQGYGCGCFWFQRP